MSDEGAEERLIGKRTVAAMLGVTVRQVERYVIDTDDPLPVAERAPRGSRRGHRFDIRAVYEWSIGRMIGGDDEILDLGQERARLSKVQADRQELLLARERGEAVTIPEVEAVVGDDYSRVRARVLAIPPYCAPLVFGAESVAAVRGILDDAVRDALTELSNPDTIGTANTVPREDSER